MISSREFWRDAVACAFGILLLRNFLAIPLYDSWLLSPCLFTLECLVVAGSPWVTQYCELRRLEEFLDCTEVQFNQAIAQATGIIPGVIFVFIGLAKAFVAFRGIEERLFIVLIAAIIFLAVVLAANHVRDKMRKEQLEMLRQSVASHEERFELISQRLGEARDLALQRLWEEQQEAEEEQLREILRKELERAGSSLAAAAAA